MGMHSKTSYNHFQRLYSAVKDCYSMAECFGSTQEKLLESLSRRVYSDKAWSKLPQVYRAHIAGWQDATRERWYQDKLEWKVFWRGRYVDGSEVETGTWNECETDAGCFFWRKRGVNGELRPFSEMKTGAAIVEIAPHVEGGK